MARHFQGRNYYEEFGTGKKKAGPKIQAISKRGENKRELFVR
jgi:hypothetical protein